MGNVIKSNPFRECLNAIPKEQKKAFERSYRIAERLSDALKEKGMTAKEFAQLINRSEIEVLVWLTGRHRFTTKEVEQINTVI